jgi:hypothetical protein
MKKFLYLPGLCLLFTACKKQGFSSLEKETIKTDVSVTPFTQFIIRQGKQFCDQSSYIPVEYSELKFVVKFDNTAVYKTIDPSNQYDINKLYGFSDNDSAHHLYSARFGWRWSDKALRIFAYAYNSGVRMSKELGTVLPGIENYCSIKVTEGHYVFTLNNTTDTLLRSATTSKAKGYKLYPYFGGDETAPHQINVFIKEFKAD